MIAAGQEHTPAAAAALEALCRGYWYPLYVQVRRRGHDFHEARDLTQAFFARLIEKRWLDRATPEKGRFRSYLLAALDHFLANDWRHRTAMKRGGGVAMLSIDEFEQAEDCCARDLASDVPAGRAYDLAWASTVLTRAMSGLREEFEKRGRRAHFDEWKVYLSRPASGADCAESARRLSMSPGAASVGIHRMRERYGALLRETVAHTVPNPADVEDELRYLIGLIGSTNSGA